MQIARLSKENGDLVLDDKTGRPVIVSARRFGDRRDYEDYLHDLEQIYGQKIQPVCFEGCCRAPVTYTSAPGYIDGERNDRPPHFTSLKRADHVRDCPAPSQDIDKDSYALPATLKEAATDQSRMILINLNFMTGMSAVAEFSKRAGHKSVLDNWKADNKYEYSRFHVKDAGEVVETLRTLYERGGYEALNRTFITHEKSVLDLRHFIVLDDAGKRAGLFSAAFNHHSEAHLRPHKPHWVSSFPRLILFDTAYEEKNGHSRNRNRVRGVSRNLDPDRRLPPLVDRLFLDPGKKSPAYSGQDFIARPQAIIVATPKIRCDRDNLIIARTYRQGINASKVLMTRDNPRADIFWAVAGREPVLSGNREFIAIMRGYLDSLRPKRAVHMARPPAKGRQLQLL